MVTGIDGDRVRLEMRAGGEKLFRPDGLAKNLRHDAVSIYQVKQVELHAGDRIRWTDTDRQRGLNNADLARVEEVGKGKLVVSSLADGTLHQLNSGDRMLEQLDLAYAINVHVAQGVTTDHGILALRSTERKLLSERSFLVALTRVADKVALIVDDGRKVERGVLRNRGDKTSALEVTDRIAGAGRAMPSPAERDAGSSTETVIQRTDVPERWRGARGVSAREADQMMDRVVSRAPDLQPDYGL